MAINLNYLKFVSKKLWFSISLLGIASTVFDYVSTANVTNIYFLKFIMATQEILLLVD